MHIKEPLSLYAEQERYHVTYLVEIIDEVPEEGSDAILARFFLFVLLLESDARSDC